ncbi:MAG: alpha/beta hydrolase [Anaerolineae bacterium]|nr:alpha/beta hydrolase [Anaerolineae bacterium]
MSAIIIENGLVHYEVLGRGKPLVFIHGWLGSWRYWVPTMDDLSDRYRTYALDLWGFGDSDRRKDGYTLDGYVALLQRFMDELGLWQAPLVGHALGGVVALRLAATAPERVGQVVAVGLPMNGNSINRTLATLSAADRDVAGRVLGRRQVAAYAEVGMETDKTDSAAVAQSVQAVLQADLLEDLDLIQLPVLLVYGKNDPVIMPPNGDIDGEFEDNVRAIFLDDARHFPMLEEPNKFNRLVRGFLESGGDFSALEVKDEWRRRWR